MKCPTCKKEVGQVSVITSTCKHCDKRAKKNCAHAWQEEYQVPIGAHESRQCAKCGKIQSSYITGIVWRDEVNPLVDRTLLTKENFP